MNAAVPFDVTISIATYNRPELLEKTLRSCIDQQNGLALAYEILVTDNHPTGNAEIVVARLAASSAVAIRYQQNLTRNMSVLRNAGIKSARGAYVAFIDDDEFADPDWLDQLMGAIRRTGADIAVGPRLAIFAAGAPPAYDPEGAYFQRVYDLAPDALIPLTDPDGRPRFGLGTGNSIFCARTCLTDAEPFDPRFGDAGGEDIEFFMRQHIEGRTIAWAAGARVTEVVIEVRTKVAYRLIRAKRETQIFASIYMAHATRPLRTRARLALTGVAQLVLGGLIAFLTWEFGSEVRLRGRLMATVGLGKLTWKKPVGYIDETTFKPAAQS
jgi:succinoglycan biosynthesis protein ExoM